MDETAPAVFSHAAAHRRLSAPTAAGLPPVHPHNRLSPPTSAATAVLPAGGGTHSRSLSQPPFFSLEALPPLSHPLLPPAPVPLPPRKLHRRSQSDVPFGWAPPAKLDSGGGSAGGGCDDEGDIVSAFMDFDKFDLLNSSGDLDSRGSGTTRSAAAAADSSENDEVESKVMVSAPKGNRSDINGNNKRSAPEVSGNVRHCRSLSVDSFMAGRLSCGDESPGGQLSRSNSLDKPLSGMGMESLLPGLDIGSGPEFNELDKKKIAANERLAEMVLTDPKRVKRILANRQSAARSKERKVRYISELEHQVQTLQSEATTLSAQLTLLQRDSMGLANQNNEMRIRLQAMEQQAQLRDALNEALTAEVQRLKLATGQMVEAHLSNGLHHQMASQMIHLQQLRIEQRPEQSLQQQKQQKSV